MSDGLTLAAADLARSAPNAWSAFMDALRASNEQQRQNLVVSSLDELQRAQGRAQNSALLLATLETCLKEADKIQRRRAK